MFAIGRTEIAEDNKHDARVSAERRPLNKARPCEIAVLFHFINEQLSCNCRDLDPHSTLTLFISGRINTKAYLAHFARGNLVGNGLFSNIQTQTCFEIIRCQAASLVSNFTTATTESCRVTFSIYSYPLFSLSNTF